MFAILDIETTGGKYDEEGITEIAVYRYDGQEVVDQFSTLVNPEREIQPFVQKLTGINSKMLQNAPRFFQIAKRVIELTEDCVLVAHNAEFDYRILRTEFRRLGYTYNRKSLCTVALSQLLLPEQESFKLGKLVRSLGIPISDRHRAQGDALATVKLFQLLLEKDSKKIIISEQIKSLHNNEMPKAFYKIIEGLPTQTGVYYLHGKDNEIIYIGKSKNIRKRVSSHLTGKSPKSKKIQQQIIQVSFEKTGCEFIALLKEQHEIKSNQPRFNQASKHRLFPMGIRVERDVHGYDQLLIEQTLTRQDYIRCYRNKKAAVGQLFYWLEQYELCQNKTTLKNSKEQCARRTLKKCPGACESLEGADLYNKKIEALCADLVLPQENCVVTSIGRENGEYSFLLLQEGKFKGYGYYDLNHQINTLSKVQSRLIAMDSNPDCQALVHHFIKNEKYHKLIPLTENATHS
ncbi:MAG: GIY-YIG nuclease family protein [Flavobacteriales bacterium]|nr:GIY-YIG nuclease family protein [Flavobacteriales bacterium]